MTTIGPHQWVIGVAFPTTPAEFADQQTNMERHDFIRHFAGRPRAYRRALIETMMPILQTYRSWGVTVKCGFGLEDIAPTLSSPECRAFSLFAHWKEDAVDLFNGMTPIAEIVRAVPDDYRGVFDLCVCHPVGLASMLRAKKPELLTIKYMDKPLSILLWFRLYLGLFRLLQQKECSAIEAWDAVLAGVAQRIAS